MATHVSENARYIDRVQPPPLVPVRLENDAPVIWCKLEFLNPSGSTKDRIARNILSKAWHRGTIAKDGTVIEASSGSTSIALALACAQMGMRFIAFIPESATNERSLIIRAYGGEVRRIGGGMSDVLQATEEAASANPEWFYTRQFENPDNVEAHRFHTGPEILSQIPGSAVDAIVSGVGTGGTLRGLYETFTGTGRRPKAFAAIPRQGELFGSNVECCSLKFSSDVPGVVEGLSQIYHDWKETGPDLTDVEVSDTRSLAVTRKLWNLGFPVGPSSGLNLAAALKVAEKIGPDRRIVTVFPDRMERYFSHPIFADLAATNDA